jgi:DNA topoisomerase IB
LGNTPSVCRSSYIDPRIFDRYAGGSTISSRLAAQLAGDLTNGGRAAVESAVVDLLVDDERPALAA